MVAIEFSEGRVLVGAEIVHPAAKMFPTGDEEYVHKLATSIRTEGQRTAIVLTPDGQMLEGRGRWAACQAAGVTPVTRTERAANPWTYILTANLPQLAAMPEPQRAMVLGQVPMLGHVGTRRGRIDEPPSRRLLEEMTGVSATTIHRAQLIVQHGVPGLIELVAAGSVPLTTARRISQADVAVQQRFVERVRAGENPRLIAQPTDRKLARIPKEPRNTRAPMRHRHRFVREQTVVGFLDSLSGLSTLIDAAEGGLEQCITPEEAGRLLYELSRKHIAYRRICDLLKERKEQQS
ncbi:MAG TPA: hypothetical protein VH084_28390 [Mycobacterium sp.]|nr:hypothetical protein [Mycobacterium sp.]